MVLPEIIPAFGNAVTVTVAKAVASAQLPVPATTYEMVAVPEETPVRTPPASIVATELKSKDHVPPG